MVRKTFSQLDPVEKEMARADLAFAASQISGLLQVLKDRPRALEALRQVAEEYVLRSKQRNGTAPDISALFNRPDPD